MHEWKSGFGLGRGCNECGALLEIVQPDAKRLASLQVIKKAVVRLRGPLGILLCKVD